ncbi:hypothetical protein [Plantactinospora sp. WMMB782]|uniref:hypothetical protein n=1 Tax=Plantactinospora sp. WMMB782 TaxID=3404121 RepID=UPI003B953D6C
MYSDDLPPEIDLPTERSELRTTLLEHRPEPETWTCRACGQQLDEDGRCSTAADAFTRLLELMQG